MSNVSSTPRGEHTPHPGANWEEQLILYGEILVDRSGDLPQFCHRDIDPPAPSPEPPAPRPNRATRRAIKRASRRNR
ncbi:hypothetical protein [Streptomyces sp. NPDC086182]|uniref:hypothetical protein n=1 Tax=Streptomyces sp. NPDC086182 TaxID=3155058 RepID=UPI00343E9074